MTAIMSTVNINQDTFLLKFDQRTNAPTIEFKGKKYTSLEELLNECPTLANGKNLIQFCKIANFLFRGTEFDVIEDIPQFQKRYPVISKVLPQYGVFDITAIKPPEIKNGQLVFYAEHSTMHVPYCVTSTYPFKGEDACYSYSLLKEVFEE